MSCSHRTGAIRSSRCRYEREIDEGHRPALKRVLEHDVPADRPIVLCVSGIAMPLQPAAQASGVGPRLELTDGWYCVWAALDNPLSLLVRSGKIGLGECPGWKPPCNLIDSVQCSVEAGPAQQGRRLSFSPSAQQSCQLLLGGS